MVNQQVGKTIFITFKVIVMLQLMNSESQAWFAAIVVIVKHGIKLNPIRHRQLVHCLISNIITELGHPVTSCPGHPGLTAFKIIRV